MFTVDLYSFNKKENSTAQPLGHPQQFNCQMKSPCSILAPELEIDNGVAWNPSNYNYAYISTFSRYYWITGWAWDSGLWVATLKVDTLASWKTAIGNTTTYIYRAAYDFNTYASDTEYPIVAQQTRHTIALNRLFLSLGAMASLNNGAYIVGIISKYGTSYYGFTYSSLKNFLQAIYSDTYIESILSTYSIELYPEAKIAVDPTQYISSIRWFPCSFGQQGSGAVIEYGYTENIIAVGPSEVHTSGVNFGEGSIDYSSTQYFEQTITLSGSEWTHPQQTRGAYLRLNPYSTYQLFYPPFGLIDLDPMEIYMAASLKIRTQLDLKTGMGTMSVKTVTAGGVERTIARITAIIAIDLPLTNIVQVGTTERQSLANTINAVTGSTLRGNSIVEALVSGLTSAFTAQYTYQVAQVRDAVQGEIPHLFQTGGQGNASDFIGDPALYITYRWIAAEDNDDKGRPLLESRQISTLPGYIKCDPDAFSAACSVEELTEIRKLLQGGFFYA